MTKEEMVRRLKHHLENHAVIIPNSQELINELKRDLINDCLHPTMTVQGVQGVQEEEK